MYLSRRRSQLDITIFAPREVAVLTVVFTCSELHQNRPILIRDLPIFGRIVYLKVPRRQFYCGNCQRYFTEKLEFVDWERRYTQRYEENIYQRIKSSSIEQVSREERLSFEQAQGIFTHKSVPQKKRIGAQ